MDAPSGHTEAADDLVKELNALLAFLSLPITVVTPYDLTPALLLAILESIMRARLPISANTRESRTSEAKVEAMKVFLGVLEHDVLRTDIGLSEIDPRRLAAGDWDEVVFVGETLCWLGHRQELQSERASMSEVPAEPSSAGSNANTSVYTGFSRYDTSETTATTVSPFDHLQDMPLTAAPSSNVSRTPTSTGTALRRPRCIHEVEDPSFVFDSQSTHAESVDEFCDCSLNHDDSLGASHNKNVPYDHPSSTSSRPTVRYNGLIQLVEDDVEAFEARQERSRSGSSRAIAKTPSSKPRQPNTVAPNPTRHTSPAQHTLSLLNERARLLTELAKLKMARA